MTREKYIKYGVILVVVVLLFFLLMNIFGGKGHTKLYEKLAASEERVKGLERERDLYREMKDQAIAEKIKTDSMLAIKTTQTIIRYEKIPAIVNDFDREQLRRAIEGYKP